MERVEDLGALERLVIRLTDLVGAPLSLATFGYRAFGNPMTRASFGTACTRASSETPA